MVRTRGRNGSTVRSGQSRHGVSTSMHGQLVIDLGSIPYSSILLASDVGSPHISSHSSTPSSSPSSSTPSTPTMNNFSILIHTPLYHLITHIFHHLHTLLVFQYQQGRHSLFRLTITVSLHHSTRLGVFHSSPLLIPLSKPHLLPLFQPLLPLCMTLLTMLTMVPLPLQSTTSPLRMSNVTLLVGSSSDFLVRVSHPKFIFIFIFILQISII